MANKRRIRNNRPAISAGLGLLQSDSPSNKVIQKLDNDRRMAFVISATVGIIGLVITLFGPEFLVQPGIFLTGIAILALAFALALTAWRG